MGSTCLVPGCATSRQTYDGEFICARHWRLVPKDRKRLFKKAWRKHVALWKAARDGRPLVLGGPVVTWDDFERARRVMERCWRRVAATVSGENGGPPVDLEAFMKEWGIGCTQSD